MIILQKAIAASGYSSRRQAEELVKEGRVKVNGQIAQAGAQVDPVKDKITIKGKVITGAERKTYIKLNKPLGYTCTNRKFKGEKNVFDLIKSPLRLFAVGRLDKDSRGLILLTNDGDLTQKLVHPKFKHEKVYEVKIRGTIKNENLIIKKLTGGIDIGEGDGIAKAKRAKYLQDNIFVLTLTEGKKRQIRRMFAFLGLSVLDIKRIALAGLSLGGLGEGKWSYLSKEESEKLKKTSSGLV